jgi:hypothetical protein
MTGYVGMKFLLSVAPFEDAIVDWSKRSFQCRNGSGLLLNFTSQVSVTTPLIAILTAGVTWQIAHRY